MFAILAIAPMVATALAFAIALACALAIAPSEYTPTDDGRGRVALPVFVWGASPEGYDTSPAHTANAPRRAVTSAMARGYAPRPCIVPHATKVETPAPAAWLEALPGATVLPVEAPSPAPAAPRGRRMRDARGRFVRAPAPA